MVDPQVLAFVGVAALLTVTPGADTMLVLRSVLLRGPRAGLLTAAGICSGLFIHATLSALGLSLVLVRSATAFEIVKWLGAAYLLFLGVQSIWQAFRRPSETEYISNHSLMLPPRQGWRSLAEGLLSNVLNPKVAIFYLAFLPQFISPGDAVLAKSVLLATIHFVLSIAWFSAITVFVGRVRRWITRPQIQRRLQACTGALLIVFGMRLALERR